MKKLLLFYALLSGFFVSGSDLYAAVPIINYPGNTTANNYTFPLGTAIATQNPVNTGGTVGTYAAVTTWATEPAGYDPYGIATDALGNSYVISSGKTRVYQVSSTGTLTALTFAGGNPLTNPTGIVMDGNGNLFIADETNGYVYKFTIAGTTATLVATIGNNSAGNIFYPYGVAVDAANNLYVADTQGGGAGGIIFKIASGSTTVTSYSTGYTNPLGVALDASGNLYVSSSSATTTIVKLTAGVKSNITGFTTAKYLSSDGLGNIYVADAGAKVIDRINSSGTVTAMISTGLTAPYQCSFDAALDMYIADYSSLKVLKSIPAYYTYTGTLPTGLTFSKVTGAITGTPTAAGSFSIVVTAASTSGNSAPVTVNFNCGAAPTIAYTGSPYTYYVGSAITSLTPTVANMPTSYSISPNLTTNTGLAFSTTTGVISGTPTSASAGTTYTITATNAYGSGNTTISVTVLGVPTIAYTGSPYSFTVGTAITTLTPAVTNSPASYSISPSLFTNTGLTFSTTTGQISGTPTTVSAAVTYTIMATNAAGSGSTTISVTVAGASPPTIAYTGSPFTYSVGTAIPTLTPAVTNAPTSYSVSPNLNTNTGLAFNTSTGVISGTPTTTSAAVTYTVTATNSAGSGMTTISIQVYPAIPTITYTGSPFTYYTGAAITTLTPSVTNAPNVFTISPNITTNTGLTFSTTTGQISGTPTSASTAVTYTITASDGNPTLASTTISITVLAPPTIAYTGSPYTYTVGTAITSLTPIVTNNPASYAISPSLNTNTGLIFSTTTGQISGTPTTASAATVYTITDTNPAGSGNTTITVTVYPKPPTVAYSGSPYTFYVGVPITTQTPTTTNAPTSFTISPNLTTNTGLTFTTTTGVISGTPTTTSAATTYTVTAFNANPASGFTSISITVVGAPILAYTGTPYTYVQGTTATISISNTGGLPTSTYALTGTLPTGITYAAATGTFTIGTTAAVGAYSFTVTASNPAGSSSAPVSITINPKAPVITYTTPNTWTVGTAYTLSPTNTGGTVSTWSYTGTFPPGVTLNTSTGVISGTPTTPGSYSVTVTGTNVTGASSKTVAFTINQPAPNISYVTPVVYESGATVNLSVTNPQSAVTTSYAVTTGTLPSGLTLNAATGLISGTVPTITTSSTTTVTITAYTGSSSGTTNVSITYNPLPPAITYTNPSPYVQGTAISALTPADSGGPVSTTGTYIGTVVEKAANGVNKPYGMAADTGGNVYVVNYSGNSVTEYSTAGTITTTSIATATAGPVGIVFDSSNNAYVLTGTKVIEYPGGNFAGTGTPIITGLNGATGIAISGTTLYIANAGANNIVEYATTGGAPTLTITPPSFTFFGFTIYTAYISGGIAVDGSGNIYVADNDYDLVNSGVDEYNSTGTLTTEYQQGTNNSAVYIDNSGDIYVTDTGAGSVTVSTPGFGATLDTETGFSSPQGVVADGFGDYFVSDYNNNTVTEYTPVKGYYLTGTLPPGLYFNSITGVVAGTPQTTFALTTYTVTAYNVSGKSSTTFKISCGANPPLIAYTPSTNVYQLNTAITPLTPAVSGGPKVAMGFAAGTTLPGTLSNPWGMTTDASGNIWVVNYGNATVIKYNSAGMVANTFTVLANPTGVAVDAAGNFYVSRYDGRVYKYNSAGILQATSTTIGANGGTSDGIAIDAAANLYVTDNTNGAVWKIPAGSTTAAQLIPKPTGGILQPTGIAVDAAGNVFVTDIGAKAVIEYSPLGVFEAKILTGLTTPYGFYIDSNGDYFVGDSGAGTVKEYNEAGTLVCTIPATTPNPRGITMDASGNLYVSDYTNNTVKKYVPYFYSIGPALPAGLAFNTTTGAITGTPTILFGPTVFTISVDGSDGNGSTTVTLSCVSAPVFTYVSPQLYQVGIPIATLSPTVTAGGPITSASVSPTLPAGLSIDASGNITGTPTAASAATTYTITGTNAYGFSGTATVSITCAFGPTFTYVSPQVYVVGTPIAPLSPTITAGGPFTSVSALPALPAGLVINSSGVISGTPTVVTAAANYVVTATNSYGFTGTATVNITCNPALPVIAYTTPDVYSVGTAITPLTPASTGGAVATWSISPALPAGLAFDPATGIISGTPTVVASAANYVVTATNVTGSGTFTINITCNPALPVIAYTTPDVYPIGSAITPLIPTSTGGAVTTWSIGPALPAGLAFDPTTGIISGTPTVVSAATNYVVTATNAGGSGTFTINITCISPAGFADWIGVTSNDWNTGSNWSTGVVPTASITAQIGVNETFLNLPNVGPSGAATNSVAAVIIGSSSIQGTPGTSATAQAGGFVVNGGSILNVTGDITYQSDANAGTLTASLSGAGMVNATDINVTANTTLASAYTESMLSSVSGLNISGNISLTSSDNSGTAFNSTFNITGGTVNLAGVVSTTNTSAATSTLTVIPGTTATLQFANASALTGLSATGANVISFDNPGATVEYSGAAQTYYTDAVITGLSTGILYNSLKFSGSGVKSPNGTASNKVFIAGDFTNALTTNDAADYINFVLPAVIFNGATQNIYAGNGTGTVFYNSTFEGTGTTTIQNGNLYVASSGVLTLGGTATLAAGGFLTLNSDATGSASVAPVPAGCNVSGTVNVQRYISGERGYRLISSPVYAGTSGSNNIYSMNYLLNSLYLTGSGSGFTTTGNPTLYLYDEGFVPQYTTFYNSNFIAISSMTGGTGTNPAYTVNTNGAGLTASYSVPAGNGFYCFYRGNLSEGTVNLTNPGYTPLPTTLTASGALNIGQIQFADWYTPSSYNLGGISQNYNLVGNPYASAIDLGSIQGAVSTSGIYITPYDGTNGISKFIYELNPNSGSYGIYTYDGSATPTNGAGEFIASGQGFMVLAYGTTSQLTFNESAKAATANADAMGEMAKRVANFNLVKANPLLVLKMSADSIHTEETILSFNQDASSKYVFNEDAPHRAGVGIVGISSMSSDNMKMAINSQPLLANMTIPLNVNATVSGLYNIALNQISALPSIYEVWLKDAYKKDSLDIKDNPTYNFDINISDTGSYGSNRFSLVIRENPALMVHLLSFNATKAIAGVNVLWTTENEQNYTNFTVERSTDGGNTFADLSGFASSAIGAYTYLDKNPVIGANMYRLKIIDLTGAVTYSSVVTIMYSNTSNTIALNGGMMVYPNPTAGMVNLSIQQTTSTSPSAASSISYKIEIVNNLGIVVRNAVSSTPTWSSDVTSLLPGTYFINVVNAANNAIVGKSAFVKL